MTKAEALALLSNIPKEMQERAQWVVWKYIDNEKTEKPLKVPHNARSGFPCDYTQPAEWCSFPQAVEAFARGDYAGIGYVFSADDPWTVIDLDKTNHPNIWEVQQRIYENMASYSERSPSGQGLHIIVRGKVPNKRIMGVEVYGALRFSTMTGDIFQAARPIVDRQYYLDILYKQLVERSGGPVTRGDHSYDEPQREDDASLWNRAAAAADGEKFKALWNGNWQDQINESDQYKRTYGDGWSQSEADLALVNILGYYSQNRQQIERMFRQSGMYRSSKKYKQYIPNMITLSFDRLAPRVDFTAIREAMAKAINEHLTPKVYVENSITQANPYQFPPGLVGDIAQFILESAQRPVPEIALAGALTWMAGVCGQGWNVSGTGLNLYIMLLAKTAVGKEGMGDGIDKLHYALTKHVPSINDFRGPGSIASGPGLLKHVASERHAATFSIIGEWGHIMQQLADPRISEHNSSLRRILLDLFHKSGFGKVLQPHVYSNVKDNTPSIISPAFSFCGETTPEILLRSLNEDLVENGLLPRFIVIDYKGDRVSRNKSAAHMMPSEFLVDRCRVLVSAAQQLMQPLARTVVNVKLDGPAEALMDAFDHYADTKIIGQEGAPRFLWNRAHLLALKLAAIVAVGIDFMQPVITVACAQWAIDLIDYGTKMLVERFEKGEIGSQFGSQEAAQVKLTAKCLVNYFNGSENKKLGRAINPELQRNNIFTRSYLHNKLHKHVLFTGDRGFKDMSVLLDRALRVLAEHELIQKGMPDEQRSMLIKDGLTFKSGTTYYVVLDPKALFDFAA